MTRTVTQSGTLLLVSDGIYKGTSDQAIAARFARAANRAEGATAVVADAAGSGDDRSVVALPVDLPSAAAAEPPAAAPDRRTVRWTDQ